MFQNIKSLKFNKFQYFLLSTVSENWVILFRVIEMTSVEILIYYRRNALAGQINNVTFYVFGKLDSTIKLAENIEHY